MIEIILLIVLLFFSKSITYSYVSDDVPVSMRTKSKGWKHWFWVLEGSERSKPQIDHFITTVIHGLVCAFIYLAFGKNDISFLTALLFAFNPINNQGSVWISGRAYVLSTLGLLMAITFPIFGPAILLITTYFNVGYVASVILIASPVPMLALFLPICWLVNLKRFRKCVKQKTDVEMFDEDKAFKWQKFVLATKTFGFYLVHAIIPIKTTFYHSFLQSAAGCGKDKAYSFKDRFFWIGLVSIVCIVYYWFSFTWNIVSFGLLWWCIGIAPFLNFFRCNQEIAERYAYFPNVGLMFVLASLIQWSPVLSAVFIAMYATKLWFYMDSYQNDFYLNESSCLNSPSSWFAWHVRGHIRWNAKSYHEAAIMWTMAKNISPKEFKVLFNLAVCCMSSGHKEEALYWLDQAKQNIPAGQEKQSEELINEFKTGKQYTILL